MSSASVVVASGVHKAFHRGAETVHALRGASLDVRAGEIVGLAGASGSGKSTLLAVLCGWEAPDEGTVAHADAAVPAAALPWESLALVPQTLGLLEDLTVRENVELSARLRGRRHRPDRERSDGLLDRLGLTHLARRLPKTTSVGEQQRTAIARALYAEPTLLLADEPTAHQDHGWAQAVLDALRAQADAGGALLVVSHDPQTLDSCDRVLTMVDGTLR
ncbi:ATP-binding cassette domain-containing protein [Jatrophihabitans sp.]|uniref:ABC transporter ATP-binding protein n=1 Tax=Jatrophihabitans sp. TaxID=1932789 RepID=UPI0030C72206|nr:Transporter subunit: ATP-binding component of superfamily [Jatrophihabitans sp.]